MLSFTPRFKLPDVLNAELIFVIDCSMGVTNLLQQVRGFPIPPPLQQRA
jgi:hypothetical protein